MAVIDKDFDESGWDAWVASRPPIIQAMAAKVRYNRFYRLQTTGQRCELSSYSEDGTITILIKSPIPYEVFGVNPDDLEECD